MCLKIMKTKFITKSMTTNHHYCELYAVGLAA